MVGDVFGQLLSEDIVNLSGDLGISEAESLRICSRFPPVEDFLSLGLYLSLDDLFSFNTPQANRQMLKLLPPNSSARFLNA